MESADRALGVFLQIVEERRFEPILHAFQNGQMQLQQFFHGIEYPAKHVGLRIACELLDIPVRHQIEVELRAHALQRVRQPQGRVRRFQRLDRCWSASATPAHHAVDCCAKPSLMTTAARSGLSMVGAEGVLEASDKHRLVDEGVERTAQPAPFGAEIWPVRCRHAGDNQDLEVRAMRFRSAQRRRQQSVGSTLAIVMNIPIARMLAERFASAATA